MYNHIPMQYKVYGNPDRIDNTHISDVLLLQIREYSIVFEVETYVLKVNKKINMQCICLSCIKL